MVLTNREIFTSRFRHLNLQSVRRAVIATTGPARTLSSSLALPDGKSSAENVPEFGLRECGLFQAARTDFGQMMTDRPYDQSNVVLTIDDSKCTFRNLHALDGSRRVLYEQQLPFGVLPIALEILEPTTATYPSVGYLSNTLVGNFYHWLLYVLPLLRLYEQANLDIERFYVGSPLKAWQIESLSYVGLTEDMIISDASRAEVAHVAVPTRHTGGISPEQIHWARSKFVPNEPALGDKLFFLGRGQALTRQMLNEEAAAAALEREFGFEYITTDGMTLAEEMEVFSKSAAIVAPYGAAMTNLLFAPKGIKVLELTAYDNDFSPAHCYQEMSAAFGNQHGVIRGQPTPRRKRGVNSDVLVPLDQLLREVDKMMKAPATTLPDNRQEVDVPPPTIDLREAAVAPQQPAPGRPQDR